MPRPTSTTTPCARSAAPSSDALRPRRRHRLGEIGDRTEAQVEPTREELLKRVGNTKCAAAPGASPIWAWIVPKPQLHVATDRIRPFAYMQYGVGWCQSAFCMSQPAQIGRLRHAVDEMGRSALSSPCLARFWGRTNPRAPAPSVLPACFKSSVADETGLNSGAVDVPVVTAHAARNVTASRCVP